ncbi:hypothetical protein ES703_87665 [subsurface metagenome]
MAIRGATPSRSARAKGLSVVAQLDRLAEVLTQLDRLAEVLTQMGRLAWPKWVALVGGWLPLGAVVALHLTNRKKLTS